MWKRLLVVVVVIACGNKSDPAKETPKPAPVGSGSGSAAVAPAKPAKPAKIAPAKLTKEQLADVRKHMKAGWAAQKRMIRGLSMGAIK